MLTLISKNKNRGKSITKERVYFELEPPRLALCSISYCDRMRPIIWAVSKDAAIELVLIYKDAWTLII